MADGTLQSVVVKVLRGAEPVCQQTFKNVPIVESMLNLSIGAELSCPLGQLIAESPDLAFQVCLGAGNCLKPMPIGNSPYAISASYASIARQAARADEAVEANWTRWLTADRDMLVRPQITTGLFDLGTPSAADAAALYGSTQAFAPTADAGFLLWTPVADPAARTLHFSAKDPRSDHLVPLNELVLAADSVPLVALLRVDAPSSSAGLVVASGEALITGDTEIVGSFTSAGALRVEAGSVVVSGGLSGAGDLDIGGALLVSSGGLSLGGSFQLAGDLSVTGDLTLTGALTAPAGALSVSAQAAVGPLSVGGDVTVGADLVVEGPAVFKAFVELDSGTVTGGTAADLRYVAAPTEARASNLGGTTALSGTVTAPGGVDFTSQVVTNARFPVSSGAPFPCNAASEGAFTVNSAPGVFEVCIGGIWKRVITAACGDGSVNSKEECDDGNLVSGDGCSDSCIVETHYACTNLPQQASVCGPKCGDMFTFLSEQCDDGDTVSGNGCSAECQIEFGWTCLPETGFTQCSKCGDGLVMAKEGCDDGNLGGGDGCSSSCTPESGWQCEAGSPSYCWRHGNVSYAANYGVVYYPNADVLARAKSLTVTICGGSGGDAWNVTAYRDGGNGHCIKASFSVASLKSGQGGSSFELHFSGGFGGRTSTCPSGSACPVYAGGDGFFGGGGHNGGGGGGGAMRMTSGSGEYLFVAGGGGGAAHDYFSPGTGVYIRGGAGGDAGYPNGAEAPAIVDGGVPYGVGGFGGRQDSPGGGRPCSGYVQAGGQLSGAAPHPNCVLFVAGAYWGSGAGGGGWYGGGHGGFVASSYYFWGGGGGGSSYIHDTGKYVWTNLTHYTHSNTDGSVLVEW